MYKSLQGKLVLHFFLLILITNGLFALVSYSRENIRTSEEIIETAAFIGSIMHGPSGDFLKTGNSKQIDRISKSRLGLSKDLKITIYDRNWWRKWGDEERIPAEGFPPIESFNGAEFRTVQDVFIEKELLYPIIVDDSPVGAIGIGIPSLEKLESRTPGTDFLLLLILDAIIGVAVAVIVARYILLPLQNLVQGIEEVKEGNYSIRVKTSGTGELVALGETFNKMASKVQETVKENLMRNRMLDEKLQELWEIYELTRTMTFSLKLDEMLKPFLEKAQTLSFSSYAELIMQERITKKPIVTVSFGEVNDLSQEDYENSVNRVFLEGKLVEIIQGSFSFIFIPLRTGLKVRGVLFLGKHDSSGYSENVRRFLETICPVAASLIENAHLYSEVADLNEYLSNILSSVNSGVATIDRQNRLQLANNSFYSILGVTKPDEEAPFLEKFCSKINDKGFANEFLRKVTSDNFNHQKADDEGEEDRKLERVCLRLQKHNSFSRIIEIIVMPLRAERKVIGSIISIEDITELKNIEQQMLESEKWAILGKLAASVAHEIRNPLVAIRSLVEIIGEDAIGENKEHVNVILGEVYRLNRVVTELLSLVRPESAFLKEVSIQKLLNELIILIRHEAQKKGVTIETRFEDGGNFIKADPEKLKQAFLNIVLNAIQAMDKGGAVCIEARSIDDCVEISFYNDGPAIPDSVKSRIFEPFFTTRENGTGLGLAITKKIIDLHNGKIELNSTDKGGVEFKFILPGGYK